MHQVLPVLTSKLQRCKPARILKIWLNACARSRMLWYLWCV